MWINQINIIKLYKSKPSSVDKMFHVKHWFVYNFQIYITNFLILQENNYINIQKNLYIKSVNKKNYFPGNN